MLSFNSEIDNIKDDILDFSLVIGIGISFILKIPKIFQIKYPNYYDEKNMVPKLELV